jgi:SmpA / OmlA family
MLKRWWFWLAAILLTAGVGTSGVFIYGGQTTTLTQANFDRIQEGMTQTEVEEILGEPSLPLSHGANLLLVWTDRANDLEIEFDEHSRVMRKNFYPGVMSEDLNAGTAWKKFKSFLGKWLTRH